MDGGQQGPGLGGKQVDQGAGGVGQGQLGSVPDVGVVGGQLPGAFFTDGPDGAGDAVQEAAPVLDALGGGQGAEPGPAGKAGGLPFGPLAGADKVQPEGQGQRGQGPGGFGLAGGKQPAARRRGQLAPLCPPGGGRTGPEGGQRLGQVRQAFR